MRAVITSAANADRATVEGFGVEWQRFDQQELDDSERRRYFEAYFELFPWSELPPDAVGFDLGCGSGRWARSVAPRVGTLHCIDASADALAVARRSLGDVGNCQFHHASVEAIPLADGSMDFGYSLGVLHHVPDTAAGIRACVSKLKPGAPFLLYLYYAFDNRPLWFRQLWALSNRARQVVSHLPNRAKLVVADAIAGSVYWPLARTARMAERLGLKVDTIPLAFYRNSSFYTMRTDALDRFGTRLEQRFTANQIRSLMESSGLEHVKLRESAPYWCAIGFRAR